MSRLLTNILIATLLGILMISCKQKEKNPNILFIAVDDLRPELGCYGNPVVISPNLDELASEGLLFTNHFVQVPTCGASRLCLLSGMRPSKPSHLLNQAIEVELSDKPEGELPESFIHQLKRNGYYTVGIGKISHSADGLIYGYTDKTSSKRELPYSWEELVFNADKWGTGWNAFFGYADGENRQSLKKQVKPYESAEVDDEGYVDGLTANLAIAKLRELKDKDKPFFLGVGFFKPHLPFNAPKKYWDLYETEDIPLSESPFIPDSVNLASLHNSGELNGYYLTDEKISLSNPASDEYARKLRHAYYACVSYVDAQIGKVLSELKNLGLEKNTIVVVWGDHGWHLGDQLTWGKHTVFDKALRSTLIVKTPDTDQSGKTVETLVETVDIYPTLLQLCNVENPVNNDGESFTSLLLNPEIEKDEVAYSYFRKGISVRTNRYRLTKYFRDEIPVIELYDYLEDPFETKNLASDKPAIVKELMLVLEKGNTGLFNSEN
ncbi:MAG: sulfatase [Bacteroidales bacterium]|nr:sulfatase [Bacteroidales bacterium]